MMHNELQFVFLTKPVTESIKGARLCHRTEKEEEKKTYTAEDPLDCVDQGRRGFGSLASSDTAIHQLARMAG